MVQVALCAAAATLLMAVAVPATAQSESGGLCVDCLSVRVGPAMVVRGPFPDELDAPFTALRLANGAMRTFSANGTTYAIDGPDLTEMSGERRPVLEAGPPGSLNDCGRWLTSTAPIGSKIIGMVHQERACDYDVGRTDKSMAIAVSSDEGLTWTDLGTVLTGRDMPQPDRITGEGDCTMANGHDGYLYAYCLRNSDWQTIAARAPVDRPTEWHKYFEGAWSEPGLGGEATAVGFVGPGAGYFKTLGAVGTVATDPWFGGVRLSLATDKVTFADLKEPLLVIDGSEWDRPADTGLVAYGAILDPESGGNTVGGRFLLAYVYVPPGQGFESRYLVLHEVSLILERQPVNTQVGLALTRWRGPAGYATSTGPLTGDRLGYARDAVVAHMLTRAPEGVASVKLAECSDGADHLLAEDGGCEAQGYVRERTAGWLYAVEQPGAVPVYLCVATEGGHLASRAADCEGLGRMETLLGYGLWP